MADVYDAIYAPTRHHPDCWHVHVADLPHNRLDISGHEFLESLTARYIAQWTDRDPAEIIVRLSEVDHIPGRDAPLYVQSPDEIDMLNRLDAQLEAPYA